MIFGLSCPIPVSIDILQSKNASIRTSIRIPAFLYSVVLTLFNNYTHIGIENFESADDVLMHLLNSYRDAMSVL